MALMKKQASTDADWRVAIENIENNVSKAKISELIQATVKDIRQKTNGQKAAFCWSGGKDSIVLDMVCNLAGIADCVFVYCNLEYRQFMEWVNEHHPEHCTMINTGQDLKWLAEHPDMLFPQDSRIAGKWFKIVQHTGQERYYKDNQLDMILLGRRKADGNYCGKGTNIYTNGKGVTRFSPLSDWTHEQILACIHYYKLPLPPIYDWKNGYLCGTHNWAARQWTGSIANGWKEVYEIEPEIVEQAAEYFDSAKEFLNVQKTQDVH